MTLILEKGKQMRQTHKNKPLPEPKVRPLFPVSELSQRSFHHQSLSLSGARLHPKSPTPSLSGTAGWTSTLFLTIRKWLSVENRLLGVPMVPGQIFHLCLLPDINVIKPGFLSTQPLSRSDYRSTTGLRAYLK